MLAVAVEPEQPLVPTVFVTVYVPVKLAVKSTTPVLEFITNPDVELKAPGTPPPL